MNYKTGARASARLITAAGAHIPSLVCRSRRPSLDLLVMISPSLFRIYKEVGNCRAGEARGRARQPWLEGLID